MKNILCFGASNTYGFNPDNGGRYNENERWCGVLQNILKDNYNIIEEGCNARTVIFKDFADITTCSVDYLPYCLNKYKELDLIILSPGLNDFQTVYNAAVDEVLDGIRTLTEFIRHSEYHKDTKILILAPANIKQGISLGKFGCLFNENAVKKSEDFSMRLKEFSKSLGCEFYDLNETACTCTKDCIHMDASEHKKIGTTLANLIPTMA